MNFKINQKNRKYLVIMSEFFQKIDKYERPLFYVLVLLNLVPIFLVRFVASLDGPQHLYTSNVIVQIIQGNESVQQFFRLTDVIVGNWIGHFLLAVYNLLFPAWIAEKLLLSTYYIGIAVAFRYLLKSFPIRTSLISLLIIPFSSTSLLAMGYYNFSMAVIFFMITFGYFIRHQDKMKLQDYLMFSALLILLYLSHVFVITLFGFAFVVYLSVRIFTDYKHIRNKTGFFLSKSKHLLFLTVATIPSLALWINYTIWTRNLSSGSPPPPDLAEIINNFFNLHTLMVFDVKRETPAVVLLGYIIIVLILFIIFYHIKIGRNPTENKDQYLFTLQISWAIISISLLLLYFFFPDTIISGNVKKRIAIIFFFTLITWLCLYKYPSWLVLLSTILIVISVYRHHGFVRNSYRNLNESIDEIRELEPFIEENTVVLPLNYSDYWVHKHFLCYLGIDKPIINLGNPQCAGQFPVVWNYEKKPDVFVGLSEINVNSLKRYKYGIKSLYFADYIVIWGQSGFDQDRSNEELKKNISKFYKEVFVSSSNHAVLLKFKAKKKIEEIIEKMRYSDKWYSEVIKKAEARKMPVERMILLDALYMYDKYY